VDLMDGRTISLKVPAAPGARVLGAALRALGRG